MKGQMFAVSLVMACGLAMMIMTRSLILSLESTRDAYYAQQPVCRCLLRPEARAECAAQRGSRKSPASRRWRRAWPGRLTLDLPGLLEPADGTIISLPDDRPQQLHQLFLRRGRLPELRTASNEVVVGEAFAEAHGFRAGQRDRRASCTARGERLKIVGIALSPEFVFEARPGETLPDNRRFGVFWMNERELATAFELDGAFNNVLVDVAPGEAIAPVMAELDRLLAPYGGLGRLRPERPRLRQAARRRTARAACACPSPFPRSSSASRPS